MEALPVASSATLAIGIAPSNTVTVPVGTPTAGAKVDTDDRELHRLAEPLRRRCGDRGGGRGLRHGEDGRFAGARRVGADAAEGDRDVV